MPTNVRLRFEHFVEPTFDYFPHRRPRRRSTCAVVALHRAGVGSARHGLLGLAYCAVQRARPHGITERNERRAAVPATRSSSTSTTSTASTPTSSSAASRARSPGPTYWFNQNVIDGIVERRRGRPAIAGGFVYRNIDQGVVDTIVNGSGAAAEGSGQFLRRIQTGKVQQYAALLFGGAAVLAAVFVIIVV